MEIDSVSHRSGRGRGPHQTQQKITSTPDVIFFIEFFLNTFIINGIKRNYCILCIFISNNYSTYHLGNTSIQWLYSKK